MNDNDEAAPSDAQANAQAEPVAASGSTPTEKPGGSVQPAEGSPGSAYNHVKEVLKNSRHE